MSLVLQRFGASREPAAETAPRRVTILGATGSIGASTLDLIGRNPAGYSVVAVTGGSKAGRLAELAIEHRAELAVIADESKYDELSDRLRGTGIEAQAGRSAVIEAASRPSDWVMAAIVGIAGLEPTLAAIRQGNTVAVANKECLVSAGAVFMAEVEKHGATLLPVDSEHSAALQVMAASPGQEIDRLCLTASGGPFRSRSREAMAAVTPEEALKHPNWSMGPKVSVDSATLMNKALEMLEAQHLFGLSADKIEALIHPQSIVHCLVYYRDGSVLAQMSPPDMRTPIAYSLAWPDRMAVPMAPLDLAKAGSLTFEMPDEARFPAVRLARQVLEAGGSAGLVLNAANEIAVAAFLSGRLGFLDIVNLVEAALDSAGDLLCGQPATIADIISRDSEARARASALLARFASGAPLL